MNNNINIESLKQSIEQLKIAENLFNITSVDDVNILDKIIFNMNSAKKEIAIATDRCVSKGNYFNGKFYNCEEVQ